MNIQAYLRILVVVEVFETFPYNYCHFVAVYLFRLFQKLLKIYCDYIEIYTWNRVNETNALPSLDSRYTQTLMQTEFVVHLSCFKTYLWLFAKILLRVLCVSELNDTNQFKLHIYSFSICYMHFRIFILCNFRQNDLGFEKFI